MWLPQPVQVALPQVGQVAGEHIMQPFSRFGVCTRLAYPLGYHKRGEASSQRWGRAACDVSHTIARVTMPTKGSLMMQRDGSGDTMWERTDRSVRLAREFAEAHDLNYSGSVPAHEAHAVEALPFTGESPRHRVSGQWRGCFVQRYETGRYAVELMTMPGTFPTLHVIPSGLNVGALAIEGRVASSGDPAFDRRWTLVTDDAEFAAALLTPAMREALMHPAAEGRAVAFSDNHVCSWAPSDGTWHEARVRLDFLAVLVGRIPEDVRQRFDSSPNAAAVAPAWMPAAEAPEGPQFDVAPTPDSVDESQGSDLSDTGEFEVALLEAELESTTFLPAPAPQIDDYEGRWIYAPLPR